MRITSREVEVRRGWVNWVKERWRDLFLWPFNLVRDWPRRVQRLAMAGGARRGLISLLPEQEPGKGRAVRLHALLALLFDLVGGPEIAQYVMHLFVETTPLTADEQRTIVSVLGARAVRYEDVRIAEGGILSFIFRHNGGRAFCTWHTIHLPRTGAHTRAEYSLLVHEATHVMQYERMGSGYIGEALYAQRRLGRGAYDYGGAEGLRRAAHESVPLSAFNREAQAQIAQDYFRRRKWGDDVAVYEPYVAALRAGAF